MAWFDFLSNMFKPKELKEALAEADKIIKDKEADERKNTLSGKEFRAEMRAGQKIVEKRAKITKGLAEIAQAELKKTPRPGLPLRKKDEIAWFSSMKTDAQKEAELIKAIEKSGKPMKTDVLQRQSESISKFLDMMGTNLREAEKVTLRVSQQVTAQENEIERLGQLLDERAQLSEQLNEVVTRKLQTFDKALIRTEQKLMKMLGRKDKDILMTFQRITTMASVGSQLRRDIDFILQVLAPVAVDAPELNNRVKDELKYAKDLLKFQGALLAAMKPALKAKKGEIEMAQSFIQQLEKEAA
ncbi:hypothetical protein KY359_02085 [Candidatus Woesearchaeota archaeon]|nr:hypothetical protein [Candidatus Woesearchaeota archaeon]